MLDRLLEILLEETNLSIRFTPANNPGDPLMLWLIPPAIFLAIFYTLHFTQKIVTENHLLFWGLEGVIVPVIMMLEYVFVFIILLIVFTAIIIYMFRMTGNVLLRMAIFLLVLFAYYLFIGEIESGLMTCNLIFSGCMFIVMIFQND